MVDFVLLWVDGNDPDWRKEFEDHALKYRGDRRAMRFRNWENLRYLFRSFEKFTPWVRKIHFVTWGHLPKWLNVDHPKLNVVRHADYMDEGNLPIFNPNPIEINVHRIKDLAEKFVFFNDDTFLVSPVVKERFFKQNLPCDMAVSNTLSSSSGAAHFVLNNLEILNRHFDKARVIKHHAEKWFSPRYGKHIIRNMALLPWPRFTGFVDPHMPQPFLKSTFEEVWNKEAEILSKTSASKFRTCEDVNQYLFRYWQLAKGKFFPVSMRDTSYTEITMKNIDSGLIKSIITSKKYKMVCLNDSQEMDDPRRFAYAKGKLLGYFNLLLPEKSSFEIQR